MKAPREEEDGIIAQGSSDVNWLFPSKTSMQPYAHDSANFPPSGEMSPSGRNSSHYFYFFMNSDAWRGSMNEQISTNRPSKLLRGRVCGEHDLAQGKNDAQLRVRV